MGEELQEGRLKTLGIVLAYGLFIVGGGGCAQTPSQSETDEAPESQVSVTPEDASASFEVPEKTVHPTLRRITASTYTNTLRDVLGVNAGSGGNVGFEGEIVAYFPLALELNNLDNNAAVDVASPALVENFHTLAVELSEFLLPSIRGLFSCQDVEESEGASCVLTGLEEKAAQLWRRPLTGEEGAILEGFFSASVEEHGLDEAGALGLQYLLQSPHFLYYPEFGDESLPAQEGYVALSGYEVAARMATFLWDSGPDEALRKAAADGTLNTGEGVASEARRMLKSWQAQEAVNNFYRQLLEFDAIGSTSLDFNLYFTEFNAETASDWLHQILQPAMRVEAEVFVNQEVFQKSGTLAGLLTSTTTYVTEPLAELYQVNIPGNAPVIQWNSPSVVFEAGQVREVSLNPERRAGFLTLMGFLHSHAKPQQPSPVERGVYVLDRLLCNKPSPPPDLVPQLQEGVGSASIKTNRDRYAQHTADVLCASCHQAIDGIGFTFENYDSVGVWREEDHGYPVDSSGEIVGSDMSGPVEDALELVHALAGSRTVHDCHVLNWTRYALGRSTDGLDKPALDALREGFWASNGNIRELLVNIAASPLFRTLRRAP